jgi:hypothetical protein
MKGKIVDHQGGPDPHSYIIEDNNGKRYFAHIGDLKKNEDLIYKSSHEILQDGDEVEFTIPNVIHPHVINVKKIN